MFSSLRANRRCPFLFAPAAGRGTFPPSADGESPAEVQRKTSRPSGANTPAAVRVPRWVGAEKKPPGKGEHADAVRVPRLSGAEKAAAPFGRTRLRGSCVPLDFTLISYYTEKAKYVVPTTKQEEI